MSSSPKIIESEFVNKNGERIQRVIFDDDKIVRLKESGKAIPLSTPHKYIDAISVYNAKYSKILPISFSTIMKRYFLGGKNRCTRKTRKEYWLPQLFIFIAGMFIFSIFGVIVTSNASIAASTNTSSYSSSSAFGVMVLLGYLVILIPITIVNIRSAIERLHDINKSGAWLCISFVPYIGSIWLLVLLCMKSDMKHNDYGAPSWTSKDDGSTPVDRDEAVIDDGDTQIISMESYNEDISDIKCRLKENRSEADLAEIGDDLKKLIAKYKDAEFPEGGEYKLYELKAELYFNQGKKELAKKYIDQAVAIRDEERKASE
jgi:uncharacterized membrane protein YhaH (DUF805 family)